MTLAALSMVVEVPKEIVVSQQLASSVTHAGCTGVSGALLTGTTVLEHIFSVFDAEF